MRDSPAQAGGGLLVYEDGQDAGFTYSLAVRRLTDPQGCSGVGGRRPGSFTAPALNGTISNALGAQCHTFSRAPGEADGTYWFRTLRTSGTLGPQWRVIGPSGNVECSGSTGYQPCELKASGKFALVVDGGYGQTETGSYRATTKRVTEPTGCADLPSVSFGAGALSGNIATSAEIDCHTIPNANSGDRVQVNYRRKPSVDTGQRHRPGPVRLQLRQSRLHALGDRRLPRARR